MSKIYTYQIEVQDDNILKVGFNPEAPADNDEIVQDAAELAAEAKDQIDTDKPLLVNGPASLPVAMVLAHAFSHLVPAVACYDPKLKKYVVAIAHGKKFKVGQLLDA